MQKTSREARRARGRVSFRAAEGVGFRLGVHGLGGRLKVSKTPDGRDGRDIDGVPDG